MNTMKLGKTGITISRMGLGTWAIGGGPAWGGDKDLATCIDTIRSCPDLGINLIDTAPGYNFGNSERIVGQALSGMDRKSICLITKCGIVWNRKGSLFNKVGDTQLYKNLSPESIREEIDQSLERLQTDYVDVYMTHWQAVEPYFTPISETAAVLAELKAQGKIRAIGAANVTVDHIREYLRWDSLDLVQAKYSILDRAVEEELLPVCRENGITLPSGAGPSQRDLPPGLCSPGRPVQQKVVPAREHAPGHGHDGLLEAPLREVPLHHRQSGSGVDSFSGRVHQHPQRGHHPGAAGGKRPLGVPRGRGVDAPPGRSPGQMICRGACGNGKNPVQ